MHVFASHCIISKILFINHFLFLKWCWSDWTVTGRRMRLGYRIWPWTWLQVDRWSPRKTWYLDCQRIEYGAWFKLQAQERPFWIGPCSTEVNNELEINKLLHSREHHHCGEEAACRRGTFTSYTSKRGLESRIFKELEQLTLRKQTIQISGHEI